MKCTNCNSCIGRNKTVYNNKLFTVCKLCKKVFITTNNKFIEVQDEQKEAVLKQMNLSIID